MKRSQLILIAIGVLAVLGLYSLPKIVVENDSEIAEMGEQVQAQTPDAVEMHDAELSPQQLESRAKAKQVFETSSSQEDQAVAAEELANLYVDLGKFDSAAYYLGEIADQSQALEDLEKAGQAYYEAFSFALDPEKVSYTAEQTRSYLNQVLENDPSRLDLKTKVAMTYVSSSNPMQGITMMREILEEDPQNEDGLFNMGVLSMQSGQYKRATERFEELIKYHPDNLQGQFYLGVSYFEAKQKNKAKAQFEEVMNMTQDPMILSSIQSYLDQL